jgi:hypothetical protein
MYSIIPIHWNINSAPASPGRSHVGPALYIFSLLGCGNVSTFRKSERADPPHVFYTAQDRKLTGLLTGTPDCGPRHGGISPTLWWFVIAVILSLSIQTIY